MAGVFAATVAVILITGSLKTSDRNPGKLPVGRGIPAIGTGAKHGIVLASDGSLWSWGEHNNGWPVLGLGNTYTQLNLCRIGAETNWISIAVGWSHNLAIKSDRTLWGWGQHIYGQLGDGNMGATKSPTIPVPSAPGNDWKQAAVGGSHSLALKRDGTLWGWGNNWAGQVGIGTTNARVLKPAQIGSGTNWVKVWAGLLESVALRSDGTLWYWGDNPNPTIPQTGPASINIFAPRRVSPDTNWADVGFGPWTVLAIKSDGTLWSWGREAHLFTGTSDRTSNATPARVGTNTDWQVISPHGWLYQLLVKKDGTLWAMNASYPRPPNAPLLPSLTRIELKKDFVAFAGAGTRPFGVVLTTDGEVWTWGKVLGKDIPARPSLQYLAKLLRRVDVYVQWGDAKPTMRDKPWQLPVIVPDSPTHD